MSTDPSLETLLLPFVERHLSWPVEGGALFLHARDGWPLHRQSLPGLHCVQPFKPDYDALQRSGLQVSADLPPTQRYAMVLLLTPRQRDEARALYARAIARLLPGGTLVVCQANSEGAKSGETDVSRLAGALTVLSKNKCRVFWTQPDAPRDAALQAEWQQLDVPRPILDGRFLSQPGLFAWDRADHASQLLAEHLPANLVGRAADLGAGWGYLSAALLARNPGIVALDLYEADARALPLARHNLARAGAAATLDFHWHDVTQGLPVRYDVIVSNPPFHARQAAERPDIGRRFISAAAAALLPGGRLWLVANRHLPYESVLAEGFAEVRTVSQRDGFKVIEATRARAAAAR